MAKVRLTAERWKDPAKVYRRAMRNQQKAIERGVLRAKTLGLTILVERSPVDQGQLRAAWRITEDGIINDAPHAGIVENGARPHPVGPAGILALTDWAMRHGATDEQEAEAIAHAIAWKIRHHGQAPTYFVRDSQRELRKILKVEVEQQLKKLRR